MKYIYTLILFFLFSCNRQEEATEFYDTIQIFGDKILFQMMEETLNETVAAPHELPIVENRYLLKYRKFKDFNRYKTSKNLLFLIALDRKTVLDLVPNRLLGKTAMHAVKQNMTNFYMVKNAYAKNQALLLFVVNRAKDAKHVFSKQFPKLSTFQNFEAYILERLQKKIFKYGENIASNKSVMKKHAYRLRHSHRFKVVDNIVNQDTNLVSYFASNPTRWIWTRYYDGIKNCDVTSSKIFDLRDYTMSTFFDGDSIDRQNQFYVDSSSVNGLLFKRFQSSYKSYADDHKTLIGGGPFITYTYFDTISQRLWVADAHLFYPGKRKSLKLLELEAILATFKVKEN